MGLYADDTVSFLTGTSLTDLETRMSNTLPRITTWTTPNRLTVNIKKTKFMIFRGTRRPLTHTPDLRINDDGLDYCDSYDNLGLTLDSLLKFE